MNPDRTLLCMREMRSAGAKITPQKIDGLLRRHFDECRIVHMGRAVCAVGNCTQDAERYMVDVANLTDRRALHFAGDRVERVGDERLTFSAGDKLIAGGNYA